MTTCADWIHETRGHLYTGVRERTNTLNGSHNASTTTITLNHTIDFDAGDVLDVDAELMYVWSVTATTATVARGFQGSTAASHSDGAFVTVSPVFSGFRVFQALNAEIRSLSSPSNGLFQMSSVSVTFNSAVVGYDLTSVSNILEPYEVYWDEVGPAKLWPRVPDWEIRRNMSTTDFASGFQIVVPEGQPGNSVRVLYKAPFTEFTATTDNVTTTGIPATAYDLPALGAAARLAEFEEVQRNFNNSQGETRRAAEVPAGSQLRAAGGLRTEWDRRVREEAARLSQAYPRRKR